MTKFDVRDIFPHRMRFTKGKDNSKCFREDHLWEENGEIKVPFRKEESFPVFHCKRCNKKGFLMDNIYWELNQ